MKFEKPKKEEIELQETTEDALDEQLDIVSDLLIEMASNKKGGVTERETGELATALELINRKSNEKDRIAMKKVELRRWRNRIRSGEMEQAE